MSISRKALDAIIQPDPLGNVHYESDGADLFIREQRYHLDETAGTIQQAAEDFIAYKLSEFSTLSGWLGFDVRNAATKFYVNKIAHDGKLEFLTLQHFAGVFNPLAKALMSHNPSLFGHPAFDTIQWMCIELFEYGDKVWTGKVTEWGAEV